VRKRKILVFALAVLLVAIAATGTAAYFTAQKIARNVITTGGFDIEIVEKMINDEGELVDYPEDEIKVLPSKDPISKIVTVQNNDADAFIRCKYIITVKDSEGNVVDYPEEHIYVQSNTSDDWFTKEEADGWFYYKDIVKTGSSTSAIIDEVIISEELSSCKNCTIDIDVIAEGVQSDNNGTDVLLAEGWPVAE